MKLVLDDLSVGYDKVLLEGASMSLCAGEVHVLLGDNGLGKTTLFKTLAGAVDPMKGDFFIEGSAPRSGVALVGTDKPQIDFLSVKEYLIFGQEHLKETDLMPLLIQFSMVEFVTRDISHLSDGQFKKIALIRQLLKQQAVLLLDEPSAYLDVKNKTFLIDVLQELKHDHVVLLSTHDMDFAKKCGDQFFEISKGKILEVSPSSL